MTTIVIQQIQQRPPFGLMTRSFYASLVPMRLSARTSMDQAGKNLIISEIKTLLSKQERILFAYLHGSFTGDGPF
jgi:hypothetical protein